MTLNWRHFPSRWIQCGYMLRQMPYININDKLKIHLKGMNLECHELMMPFSSHFIFLLKWYQNALRRTKNDKERKDYPIWLTTLILSLFDWQKKIERVWKFWCDDMFVLSLQFGAVWFKESVSRVRNDLLKAEWHVRIDQ